MSVNNFKPFQSRPLCLNPLDGPIQTHRIKSHLYVRNVRRHTVIKVWDKIKKDQKLFCLMWNTFISYWIITDHSFVPQFNLRNVANNCFHISIVIVLDGSVFLFEFIILRVGSGCGLHFFASLLHVYLWGFYRANQVFINMIWDTHVRLPLSTRWRTKKYDIHTMFSLKIDQTTQQQHHHHHHRYHTNPIGTHAQAPPKQK